ncbi:MAG: CHAD domain-containing protein [Bacteroidales bacterium]|nr:CHAD domain-containing protein [Bacteroidales bacterium]MBN2821278.1 CHAD domain-containing protein [Bacteroidales bacterium]
MYKSKTGKMLFHFFHEREQTFWLHFQRLQKHLNEEDIHNLRRSGKRIRALYELFEQISDGEFSCKKRFKPIKNLFINAGLFREFQVSLNTLNTYSPSKNLVKAFKDSQQTESAQAGENLKKAIENFKITRHLKSIKKARKLCKKIKRNNLEKNAKIYIQSQLAEIKNKILLVPDEEALHAIRIAFKKISPVVSILELTKTSGFDKDLLLKIKEVEDKMGYWHDRVVLQEKMEKLLSSHSLSPEMVSECKLLISKLGNEHKSFIINIEMLVERPQKKLAAAISLDNS